jgi:hypothetical protein
MTPAEIAAWLSIAMSLVTLLGVFGVQAGRLAKMELKIDTVWDFQIRRAQSEALMQGVATKNSPVTVTDEAKQWMKPLLMPIREFYSKLGRHLSDRELVIEIERQFGDRILNEICIPHGLSAGACLLIALQAAKDDALS